MPQTTKLVWLKDNKPIQQIQNYLGTMEPKVYLSPKLWYLRVLIIEAQDIMPGHEGSELVRFPEFSTKIQMGNYISMTDSAFPRANRSFSNPYWNKELAFVVAEPLEDYLLVSVEDQVSPGRNIVVASAFLPVATIEKRADEKPVTSRWFNLDSQFGNTGDNKKLMTKFVSRIHLRVSFDEGYDLLDEGTMDSSDVRPTSQIGVLEIGILGATDLMPEKTKIGRIYVNVKKKKKFGRINAYCIAKYGKKWVRTSTVVDSLSPKWNEDYTWEVYDPCSVVTIGVFNSNYGGPCDYPIGKVRIRLSTLENDRVYSHSYPLLMLCPLGVKKVGELHLSVRFSCANVANMLHKYTMPLLPRMHYMHPLSVYGQESLRKHAMNVVASKMSGEEPPLGREIVEYMHESHTWRSKGDFFRLKSIVEGLVTILSWLEAIRNWQKPVYSAFLLIIFLTLVMLPEFIIPTISFFMVCLALWNYRYRPRGPPYMDPRLSHAEGAHADELDEEFDTFPTRGSDDIVRMRYDTLRKLAGRVQTVAGDVAAQGERFQALLYWRDPRATFLFLVLCWVAIVCLCVVPIRVVVALFGLYSLRPPRFRSKLPSPAVNFFKRLPSKADGLISKCELEANMCQDTESLLIVSILEDLQRSHSHTILTPDSSRT